MHRWFAILLVAVMFTVSGWTALAVSPPTNTVTIQGLLEQVMAPGPPHLEINGYVVIHDNPEALTPLLGQEVIATGVEVSGPSIYMRKALRITTLLPVPTAPQPPRFHGTPYYALFGQVVKEDGSNQFYVRTDQYVYQLSYRVRSEQVDLQPLVGRRVAALVLPDLLDGQLGYLVQQVIPLDTDIATWLQNGEAGVYSLSPEPVRVTLNGQPIPFDHDPILGNGRLLVGLRPIAEALGATVRWSEHTQTAIVTRGDNEVRVRIGSNRVVIRRRGEPERVIITDIAPVLAGGRTTVPLRVLSEGLGLQVNWNEALGECELH